MSGPSIILGITLMDEDHAVLESLLMQAAAIDDAGLQDLLDQQFFAGLVMLPRGPRRRASRMRAIDDLEIALSDRARLRALNDRPHGRAHARNRVRRRRL